MNIKIRVLCALIAAFQSLLCSGQNQKVETDLQSVMSEFKIVGLSVAVVRGDEIVYKHSLGYQNVEKGLPLEDKDIFRIASISKSFSAVSIMQLREAKKLSLNDDFSKLVGFKIRNPKYPKKVITLKMVMSHRSSINDSQGYFNLDVINPDKNPDYAKCYNDYAPGKGYQYCNLNYNMIGAVIERLSGQRFDLRVKEHVLDPLGLYGGYRVDGLDSALFATLYDYDSANQKFVPSVAAYAPRRAEIENYVMGNSTPIFSPTGGMKISASDLAKYMIMHMNAGQYNDVRLLSKKSSKLMQKKISKEEGYGLAIMTTSDLIPGKIMKGHTGSAYGLYSAMFFQPKEKFGIVVIINGGIGTPIPNGIRQVLRKVIGVLYDDVVIK